MDGVVPHPQPLLRGTAGDEGQQRLCSQIQEMHAVAHTEDVFPTTSSATIEEGVVVHSPVEGGPEKQIRAAKSVSSVVGTPDPARQRHRTYNALSEGILERQVEALLTPLRWSRPGRCRAPATLLFVDAPNVARARWENRTGGADGIEELTLLSGVMLDAVEQWVRLGGGLSDDTGPLCSPESEETNFCPPLGPLFVLPVYGKNTTFGRAFLRLFAKTSAARNKQIRALRYEETQEETYPRREADEKLVYDPVDAVLLSLALKFAKRYAPSAPSSQNVQLRVCILSRDKFRNQPYIDALLHHWGGSRWTLSNEKVIIPASASSRPFDQAIAGLFGAGEHQVVPSPPTSVETFDARRFRGEHIYGIGYVEELQIVLQQGLLAQLDVALLGGLSSEESSLCDTIRSETRALLDEELAQARWSRVATQRLAVVVFQYLKGLLEEGSSSQAGRGDAGGVLLEVLEGSSSEARPAGRQEVVAPVFDSLITIVESLESAEHANDAWEMAARAHTDAHVAAVRGGAYGEQDATGRGSSEQSRGEDSGDDSGGVRISSSNSSEIDGGIFDPVEEHQKHQRRKAAKLVAGGAAGAHPGLPHDRDENIAASSSQEQTGSSPVPSSDDSEKVILTSAARSTALKRRRGETQGDAGDADGNTRTKGEKMAEQRAATARSNALLEQFLRFTGHSGGEARHRQEEEQERERRKREWMDEQIQEHLAAAANRIETAHDIRKCRDFIGASIRNYADKYSSVHRHDSALGTLGDLTGSTVSSVGSC